MVTEWVAEGWADGDDQRDTFHYQPDFDFAYTVPVSKTFGFSVNAVDSGVAAVTTARQTKPDVVLFDLQLRDVSGHDLVNWLRANPALHDVPLIAISVLSRDDGAGSIMSLMSGGTLAVTGVPIVHIATIAGLPVAPDSITVSDTAAHIQADHH